MSRMLSLFSSPTPVRPARVTVTAFAEALRVLGDEHFRFGRYRQARRNYRAAIRVEPKVAALRVRLAKAWEQDPLGNDDFAYRCYRKAVRIDSNDADAWAGLALAAGRMNRRHLALRAIAKAVALAPANAEVLGMALALYRDLGKLEKAWSMLCKARFLTPQSAAVKSLWDRARFDMAAKSPRVAKKFGRSTIPFLRIAGDAAFADFPRMT